MTVSTRTNDAAFAADYEELGVVRSSARDIPQSASSTRLATRIFDRFQLVMLPFAAAAAVAAPSASADIRTFSSRVGSSYTRRMDVGWWLDDWTYTTEATSLADVIALNRLLALPAAEGLTLDYPDD
jgi:hypothetical protein